MHLCEIIVRYHAGNHRTSLSFETVEAAFRFLWQESDTNEIAIENIALVDGTLILSREDIEELKTFTRSERTAMLRILDRCISHVVEVGGTAPDASKGQ